jgi:putative SOS response-associated peptidase YedK
MCFHYSLTKERAEIEIQLGATWDDDWQPVNYVNGFTFPKMPIISQKNPNSIQLFNWGLIPHWIKSNADADKIRTQTLNAHSETVFEKPSFRTSIQNNRCLIIADGFFEWMDFHKKKYPHFISMKLNSIFCFAGIFSSWTDKVTGEHLETFSILTSEANPMLAKIHNSKQRMPVIVPSNQYKKWLTPDLSKKEIESFFKPYPEIEMQNHTISKRITSRTDNPNVPEVIKPFIYPELALIE